MIEMKATQSKIRKRSIFDTIIHPMLILLAVEILLVVCVPLVTRIASKLNRNEESMLGQQVENRKNYLENFMISEWSDLRRISALINEQTQEVLKTRETTVETLCADSELVSEVLLGVADDMVTELYAKRVSGIYVMFNTQDLKQMRNRGTMPSCQGMYIRDLDPTSVPSERNADLFLGCAPTSVVRAMKISTDTNWKPVYMFDPNGDVKQYDFLYQPFQAAYEAEEVEDPEDFGFWAPGTSEWHGGNESSVTYSQPLVLEDGTVYGVLGIELHNDYLCSLLPYQELMKDELGSYVLGWVREEDRTLHLADALVSGIRFNASDVVNSMKLQPTIHQEDGYECVVGDVPYYVAAKFITLYGSNTPFESQKWVLLGVVDKDNLYLFTKNLEVMLGISVMLMLLFGVLGAIVISRSLSVPIRRLSGEVYGAQENKTGIPRLSRTGIHEIDRFALAITELSQDVVNTSTRFLRIIDMASGELGGFEVRQGEDAYVTDNFFSMLGIAEEPERPISGQRFREILEHIKQTIPHSEWQDGSIVYDVVKTNGEVRYIRISSSEQDDLLTGLAEDVTVLTKERKRIEHDRDYDLLTGLLNRRAFYHEVEKVFQGINREGYAAFIMLDLDDLKQTNDKFGHEWGDQYLQQAARGFVSAVPTKSVLARLAGDEFALFIYGYNREEAIRADVKHFEEMVHKNVFIAPDGNEHPVRVSGGIAWYPNDSWDLYDLMKYADFAMYQIKHGQKGSLGEFDFASYNQESFLAQNRRELQQMLAEELVQYHFQPIFCAKDGSVYAYEALMRVNMPTLRTPDAVLNLARKENRLRDIERLSMLKATQYYLALRKSDMVDQEAYLFVNSIADQYIEESDQMAMMEQCGDFVSKIVIEITECNEMAQQALEAKRTMSCFSGMFALDDYGSGYNGEKNLLELKPNYVKLDISIVRGLDSDVSKQHIVKNLLSYAHQRDMLVVAEGLETQEEIRKVLELGVDLLQGYGLARPAAIPTKLAQSAGELIEQFWREQKST